MSRKTVAVVVSREELVARKKRDGRNIYEPSAKRRLIEACEEPGVSISGMALAHGLNTNVLRKWMTRARKLEADTKGSKLERRAPGAPKLLPVTMLTESTHETLVASAAKTTAPSNNDAGRIHIELGGARISVDAGVNADALSAVFDCLRRTGSTSR